MSVVLSMAQLSETVDRYQPTNQPTKRPADLPVEARKRAPVRANEIVLRQVETGRRAQKQQHGVVESAHSASVQWSAAATTMQTQRFYPSFSVGRYSPTQYARSAAEQMRRQCMTNVGVATNLFGGIDEGIFSARAEAAFVAGIDMKAASSGSAPNPMLKAEMLPSYSHLGPSGPHPQVAMPSAMEFHLDPIASNSNVSVMPSMMDQHHMAMTAGMGHHQFAQYSHSAISSIGPPPFAPHHSSLATNSAVVARHLNAESETDPRELEAFAEHFKQRRIKLGVTQADVGKALGNLKLPGVGSLSQSTICRFESLTLSHNNMIALKPILAAWLEQAESTIKDRNKENGILPNTEKKRKRTSIAAPEKRSLEAYFAVQPRPSGEKIAAIAEKLDLKKNVVRVWFCNQRQKQKR
ncbi:unnamed protein product [Soboliphyme baturini]|uniref:POU domain protein n=1 Tax=Soboliphyme baturini TaxID=241478 RepID=A0A183IRZ9_9BILA|nr:unnamed protein product [Soboliphyme baturini]